MRQRQAPNLDEEIAPPRKNGELVFEAPWESRTFAMALVLHEQNAYSWPEFSQTLAAEIAEHERDLPSEQVFPVAPDTESTYYRHWLEALERLLRDRGILSEAEIEARSAEFAAGLWDEHH